MTLNYMRKETKMSNHIITYFETVQTHRKLVLQIGRVIGLPTDLLIQHDLSKFDPVEFMPYAEKFGKNGDTKRESNKFNFEAAWLHHINYNPHHWQHWCLCEDPQPMPMKYIREMVVDWQACEIQYQKRQDMSEWLNREIPKMLLHEYTVIDIQEAVWQLGYYKNGGGEYTLNDEASVTKRIKEISEGYLGEVKWVCLYGHEWYTKDDTKVKHCPTCAEENNEKLLNVKEQFLPTQEFISDLLREQKREE
jgi:hypothetical protein